jgi:hypothetical protein
MTQVGDVFFELDQVGDDVVGSFRLEFDEEGEAPASGDLAGRVSGDLLTLFSDYPGELNHNPGRIHFFLELVGSELEGTWSWDGAMSFGTMTLTRQ